MVRIIQSLSDLEDAVEFPCNKLLDGTYKETDEFKRIREMNQKAFEGSEILEKFNSFDKIETFRSMGGFDKTKLVDSLENSVINQYKVLF